MPGDPWSYFCPEPAPRLVFTSCFWDVILGFSVVGKGSQVLLPFNRQEVFLFAIALLARRDDIPLAALPAAAEGHHMIHGEILPVHLFTTIMALPGAGFPHPPGRLSQVAGLFLLFSYGLFCYRPRIRPGSIHVFTPCPGKTPSPMDFWHDNSL